MKSLPIFHKIKCLILILFLVPFTLNAQNRSEEFKLKSANNLYNQRLYKESLKIYKDLYSINSNNKTYYQKYLSNLIQLKMYSEAINIIQFQLLKNPNDPLNRNQLAQLYFKKQNKEKAFEIWSEILNGPTLKVHEYSQIASTLISERLFEKAIECYQIAQTKLKNPGLFLTTIARLYTFGFNYKKAFETHLYNLTLNKRYLNTTRRQLLQMISKPEALEAVLENMHFINDKDPNHLQIQVAIYMKSKDYKKALDIITQPIFKTSNTLIDFGHEAQKLGEYELAEKAYHYVLDHYGKRFHYSAFNGLLTTQIKKSKLIFSKKDSLYQLIDNLYSNSLFKNEVGIELIYNSHLLEDRYESKQVISSLNKIVKTYKLKKDELNKALDILAKSYYYDGDFNRSREHFDRVPDTYNNGEKYLFLSSIELLLNKSNIENLNSILRQKDGLTNVYLNDEIKILLLLNNKLKKDEHIKSYAESFYFYILNKYDESIEKLDSIKIDEAFEIAKDRFKYEVYSKTNNSESLEKLFVSYSDQPEWELNKAKYLIKTEEYDLAIKVLNDLILTSPQHYHSIEARRILREL